MIRVDTASRLHLGLLSTGEVHSRSFGGAGLMIDDPGLSVCVERSDRWSAEGPLSERALAVAQDLSRDALAIRVEKAPLDHVGLGTGTQLSLAIAKALSALAGEDASALDLSQRTGRGLRSAIGVNGFDLGGFLVDAGKSVNDSIAPLVVREPVPPEWRFVIAVPESERGLFGPSELQAFRDLGANPPQETDALCRLLVLGVLPAIAAEDVSGFGAAITEYGRKAGELFADIQGGPYASSAIASRVEFALENGASGAGQSSWGP
ncbi:MAG: beta-ribofuranosylaminobenzene 5'-phosphate synthase family protein, partial [Planctomycetota bacterium]